MIQRSTRSRSDPIESKFAAHLAVIKETTAISVPTRNSSSLKKVVTKII